MINTFSDFLEKNREIAEILGISQKAVEKRMSGALKILREQIENI